MNTEWLIARFVEQIEMVFTGCLIGGAAQSVYRRSELMNTLPAQIDDLVLICSVGRNVPPIDRIGWLVSVEDQPSREPEEGEERPPTFRYWTIETLDGRLFKWTNVQVLRVIKESRLNSPEPIVRQNPTPSIAEEA